MCKAAPRVYAHACVRVAWYTCERHIQPSLEARGNFERHQTLISRVKELAEHDDKKPETLQLWLMSQSRLPFSEVRYLITDGIKLSQLSDWVIEAGMIVPVPPTTDYGRTN